MRYESRQELADKIVWEGGTEEFFINYGFSENDIDGEADPELWAAAADLTAAIRTYNRALTSFVKLLPESEEW